MIHPTNELETFLLYFSQLEEVPLQLRHDFFAHVVEVGGLDQKAQDYIDQVLERLDEAHQKKIETLREKYNLTTAALKVQSEEKTPLKKHIVQDISEWMMDEAGNFKEQVHTQEMRTMKKEEVVEQEKEEDAVEVLKLNIN